MIYITYYSSPIGKILLASKENKLIGIQLENQKFGFEKTKEKIEEKKDLDIFKTVQIWLEDYFKGNKPSIKGLSFDLKGTPFQKKVWQILFTIPYGKTVTYKDIAQKIANKEGIKQMSCQAVGNAISKNPIAIIIPCHRVIGSNGNLIGYAGGLEKKKFLLELERGEKNVLSQTDSLFIK